MVEIVEIDGEQWEIRLEDTIWIGHGTKRENRGCIVSAPNRDALLAGIPESRDKHKMASLTHAMESSIVAAFKSVLDRSLQYSGTTPERRAQLEQAHALCADMWPWVFAKQTTN